VEITLVSRVPLALGLAAWPARPNASADHTRQYGESFRSPGAGWFGSPCSVWTKQSGREHGIEIIDEYLETRSVVISTDDGSPVNPFVMR
jgi:hypothetical protein